MRLVDRVRKRIEAWLEEEELPQTELARRLHWKAPRLSQKLRGEGKNERGFRVEELMALAAAMNITIDELVAEGQAPTAKREREHLERWRILSEPARRVVQAAIDQTLIEEKGAPLSTTPEPTIGFHKWQPGDADRRKQKRRKTDPEPSTPPPTDPKVPDVTP